MLNRFRKPAQPTAASPDADARACRACGRPATRVCAYVDRRGRACATSWCAEHSVVDGQVGHAAYCRRHAGIAKAMAGSGADSAEMPDLDNRAASLCEWMANDLDGGIRAVLILAQGMHPGSEVSSRPLHRVIQGVPRRSTWMRTWMLADSTGPRWRLALCVDEERDAEVVIRVDSQEIERFVPPWIEHRARRLGDDPAAGAHGRQYVRSRILQSIAEAAVRRDAMVELGSVLEKLARSEERVKETAERSRAVLDNVADGIITLDERGIIESSNPSARRILGYPERDLVGQPIRLVVGAEEEAKLLTELQRRSWLEPDPTRGGAHEIMARRADGHAFPMDLVVSDMQLGSRRLFIGTFRDISERKAQTEAITHQALHDALTGLPNRAHFSDRLRQRLTASVSSGAGFAVLLLDLDRFKEVNDTLGHESGDTLLEEVAARLMSVTREGDVVARLGGDEFAVLAGDAGTAEAAIEAAKRVLRAFDNPVVLEETAVQVEASIGVALFPEHGVDPDVLLRHADIAMYLAKRSKSGCSLYSAALDEHSAIRLALMAELRTGIQNGELRLVYQPKVELATGRLTGVEALVRWQHPRHGLLSPDRFIPLAEDSGLIQMLTGWVLEEAQRQLRHWHDDGLDIGVAVNLSARNLHQPELLKTVAEMAQRWDVPAGKLTLEITETVAMSPSAHNVLRELKAMGMRLSIDDFGTGYSSLAYLRSLPIAEIKIDRSFVAELATREDDAAIVRSTIDLGHNLDLEVVAEGVADQAGFDLLFQYGCDYVQGNFVSVPLTADQVSTWQAAELRTARPRVVRRAG